jgi:hypothetical protein
MQLQEATKGSIMNRKVKALGLALVAALAMSAMAVSAARAEFHATTDHVSLSGSQVGKHEITVGGGFGGITCTTASLSGTKTAATESSLVLTPNYTGCTDSFGRTVHVTVEAKYRFTTPTTTTGSANVHIEGTFRITITNGSGVPICHVTLHSQTNNNVVYHTITGEITITTATNNMNTTTSGGFLNCGVANGQHTGGSYLGHTTLKGTSTAGETVWIAVTP